MSTTTENQRPERLDKYVAIFDGVPEGVNDITSIERYLLICYDGTKYRIDLFPTREAVTTFWDDELAFTPWRPFSVVDLDLDREVMFKTRLELTHVL